MEETLRLEKTVKGVASVLGREVTISWKWDGVEPATWRTASMSGHWWGRCWGMYQGTWKTLSGFEGECRGREEMEEGEEGAWAVPGAGWRSWDCQVKYRGAHSDKSNKEGLTPKFSGTEGARLVTLGWWCLVGYTPEVAFISPDYKYLHLS